MARASDQKRARWLEIAFTKYHAGELTRRALQAVIATVRRNR